MKRTNTVLGGIAILGVLLALTSLVAAQDDESADSADSSSETTVRLIDIVATDFKLEPASVSVPQGVIAFAVRNQGVLDHNLAIEDSRRQIVANSANIAAGGFATLNGNFPPGTYTMVCTLPAHREAGMVGTLTVTP